jgi:hypothetical protein
MPDKIVPENDAIPLEVREEDLDKGVRGTIKASAKGDKILGDERTLVDAIPSAVLRRICKIVPKDEFVIAEVTLKFELSGEVFGLKLGGDVSVKVTPKK